VSFLPFQIGANGEVQPGTPDSRFLLVAADTFFPSSSIPLVGGDALDAMHGDLARDAFHLNPARLDRKAGHQLRGARRTEDLVGDDDLSRPRERLDTGGNVDGRAK
jgi:hypothetical protein